MDSDCRARRREQERTHHAVLSVFVRLWWLLRFRTRLSARLSRQRIVQRCEKPTMCVFILFVRLFSRSEGRFVHPQHWPKDLEYKGKQVVVIGSGATAVTIVPAMADETAHITMLQRTPTYIISTPGEDALANWLNRCLPLWLAYTLNRWKKILLGMLFFYLMTWFPNLGRWLVRKGSKNANQVSVDQLGFDFYSTASTTGVVAQLPKEYADIDKNFSPPYNPWEQRMCLGD
jgi:monooxygenase